MHVGSGGHGKDNLWVCFVKKAKGAGQGAKTPKIKIQPNDMLGG